MAEYKLSELNSIDTVRSEDLLHLRIIKRSDMLGDEDRKMTYANFLASFNLQRFLQLTGGTMTGNLGIVKLTYGGNDLLDPTGASEVILGDVAKTFRINANGLRLTVNDATRSANVYHTLNKPTPNELGMRTNAENDARYAMKATENTFLARQIININGVGLTLKSILPDGGAFIEARDSSNALRFTVGNLTSSSDVTLVNSKGATLTLGTNSASFDKNLEINGQVQPNNWSNLDARYFTQTAADQRFARLSANNNFVGVNNFNGKTYVIADSNALNLRAATENAALFIRGYNSANTGTWYVGQADGAQSEIALVNQMTNVAFKIATEFSFNKAINVTGQVKPSDFANFDSRYVPSSLTNVLARTNAVNTFSVQQIINSDGEALALQAKTATSLFIRGKAADGTSKWYIGNGDASDILNLYNYKTGKGLSIGSAAELNTTLAISGQVQPSDWSNLDSRYFTQSSANARFMLAGATGTGTEAGGGDGIAWNAKTGLYNVTTSSGGSTNLVLQLYQGASSTPSAQLKFNYKNGGVWYRSSRDGLGFEEPFTQFYTEKNKPTPSDIGAYTKAETDQKIAAAVTDSTDLKKIYPIGIVTFFAANTNPNTAFPGTTWTYLSEGAGRTIRIGAANGSDIKQVGGADSVALSVGHIPSHTHSFSGTTSTFDYGTKGTTAAGNHAHDRGNMEISGVFGWFRSDNGAFYTASGAFVMGGSQASHGFTGSNFTYGAPVDFHASRTWTGVTNTTGNHAHNVSIGAHNHTVSGNTGATGSGSAFSVLNTYIKLMAWVRTA